MKGRKPKPTNLKILAGNPGKRSLNDAEPQFRVPGRLLNAPDYLDYQAADIWRDLGKKLLDAGLFTEGDSLALAMLCQQAARWQDAEKKLQMTGLVFEDDKGNLRTNPYSYISNNAWDRLKSMLGEFGLTPAERARLKVSTVEKEESLADQLFRLVQ